ncbi:Nif3-like dinuclear metal center hexameric protein [uncultured Selenomonas sp.]|uniref:Nif3-like dinuclear metal center hexameric protein n=1 Tax=uncultured Selenomonas sp. TaxID=159275 RepID=UPI0028F1280B|nr:Nif3-like dinuclear metal center hexameric protein [uncultured Selenomonas sp.]
MLNCQVVMNALERIAPRHLAEDWDNTGLLVGSYAQKVERILVALDVDDIVVAEAIERRADMIVAHHPAIFRGMKHLRTDLPLGRRLAALLTHGIAVAAAHTNLDMTHGGVNDVLAAHLGLEKLSAFVVTKQADGSAESLGRIGTLPAPVAIDDFAHRVRERLGVSHVRLVRAADRPVRRVAVVGGAGAEFIDTAVRRGADVYLTGDVKYHEAQRAAEQGMHLIDAGHFGTERPVLPVLADLLRAELAAEHGTAEILVTEKQRDVFDIIL